MANLKLDNVNGTESFLSKLDQDNVSFEKLFQSAQQTKRETVDVKKWSAGELTKLWTKIALNRVKDSNDLNIQRDQLVFENNRDKMFKLTLSSESSVNNFCTLLTDEQQKLVVKYFFEWIEKVCSQDAINWDKLLSDDELFFARGLKGFLNLYYQWMNERIVFLEWDTLPFASCIESMEIIGEEIEERFPNYWRQIFSYNWAELDSKVLTHIKELKKLKKNRLEY